VNPRSETVVESKEMPPLPVSNTKFKESAELSTFAFNTIIPPFNSTNGKRVNSLAGACTNSSWACRFPMYNKIMDNMTKQPRFILMNILNNKYSIFTIYGNINIFKQGQKWVG
jgi:hypothetical protein